MLTQKVNDELHSLVCFVDFVADVARQLDFTKDKVYRLIRTAKDEGLIQETREFHLIEGGKFSKEELARARQQLNQQANKLQSFLRERIQKRTGSTLQEIHVHESGEPGHTVQSRLDYRRTFCTLTNLILRRILERSRRIAVAWGRLMRAAVEEQHRLGPLPSPARENLVVLPVRGDSAGPAESNELSPGRTSLDLAQALTGTTAACRCLAGIPPFLPRIDEVNDPENAETRLPIKVELAAAVLREYVSGSEPFREIFLGSKSAKRSKPALIDQVDTILTSVGTLDAFSIGPWNAQVLAASVKTNAERKRLWEELDGLTIGDIAGVLIPRAGDSERLDAWRQTWIGLAEEHL